MKPRGKERKIVVNGEDWAWLWLGSKLLIRRPDDKAVIVPGATDDPKTGFTGYTSMFYLEKDQYKRSFCVKPGDVAKYIELNVDGIKAAKPGSWFTGVYVGFDQRYHYDGWRLREANLEYQEHIDAGLTWDQEKAEWV